MELISNLFQFAVTLLGFCLSGIWYLKDRKQTCFLLTCFYGCFALGSLYWTLYLLLFSETPQVFYVSEFGWMHRYRREQRVRCGISTLGYCAMWRWSMFFGSLAACGRAIPFPLPIAGLIFCLQAACLRCCQPQERRCRHDIY